MVKAAPKKRKSNANADFKRVKHKVGRKAPAASTHTDTSFKSRTVQVREQSVVADKAGAVLSSKNLSLAELLAKLKHHNATVRRDALAGLLEIVQHHGDAPQVRSQLPVLVTTAVELITDEERSVRTALRELFAALLRIDSRGALSAVEETAPAVAAAAVTSLGSKTEAAAGVSSGAMAAAAGVHWCIPFFRLIMFHVCAGLSSLTLTQRLDSLALVELLMEVFPNKVREFEPTLIPLYSSLVNAALAKLGSRKATTADAAAAMASAPSSAITSRTGGIMHNFKKNRKDAAATKRATKARKAAAVASGDAEVTSSMDQVVSGVSETWFRVAQALLRFLKFCSDGNSPIDALETTAGGAAVSQTGLGLGRDGASRFASATRDLRPPQLDSSTLLSSSGQLSATASSKAPESTMASGSIGSSTAASGAGSAQATSQASIYARLLKTVLSLWLQSCALYNNLGLSEGKARVDQARADEALEQVRVAAELTELTLAKVLSRSSGLVAQDPAVSEALMKEVVSGLRDAFPVQAKYTWPTARARRLEANACVARSAIIIGCDQLGVELAGRKSVDGLIARVTDWLHGEMQHKRVFSPKGNVPLVSRIVTVAECAIACPILSKGDRARLSDGIAACLEAWFGEGSAILADPELMEESELLIGILNRFVQRAAVDVDTAACTSASLWASGFTTDEDAGEAPEADRQDAMESPLSVVPAQWLVTLPRLAWQAAQRPATLSISKLSLHTIHLGARLRVADESVWDQISRWLTPIMYSQTKATQADVFGPFLSKFDIAAKLQLLDLIASLPNPQLPDAVLRAIVKCTSALQDHNTVLADDLDDASALNLTLSRLIQTPFVKFRAGLLSAEEQSREQRMRQLVSIIGFSVSVMWHGVAHEGGELREGVKVFSAVDMLAFQLRAVQREAALPVAQLLYPLLFDQLNTIGGQAHPSGELAMGLLDALNVDRSGDGSAMEAATRVLRIARVAAWLHQPVLHDAFPDAFLHAVAIGLCLLAGGARNEAFVADAKLVVEQLAPLIHPAGLAPVLLKCFNSPPQAGSSLMHERLARGWAAALRLSGTAGIPTKHAQDFDEVLDTLSGKVLGSPGLERITTDLRLSRGTC